MQYRLKLAELAEKQGRPFRIALVGAGQMGRGFASQSHRLGLQVAVVADIAPERIHKLGNDLGKMMITESALSSSNTLSNH